MTDTPALSVVLATDTFETVREVVQHLRRQSIRDRLELVIASPSGDTLEVDTDLCSGFHSVRLVGVEAVELLKGPRAAAVRAAVAPVVLIGETHSFPEPDSFEALLERHREPWTVVGPMIRNANPTSTISWANILMDFGSQLEGTPAGPVPRIASHNSSYKRTALLELGEELERLIGAGDVLNDALVARGGSLFLDERAHTYHLNVSRIGSWPRERFDSGRAYAGYRARMWPSARRIAYALGSPLIPFVRFRRCVRTARRTTLPRGAGIRIYSALFAGLCLSAAGELAGYLGGIGSSERSMTALEIHRRPHLNDGEHVDVGD